MNHPRKNIFRKVLFACSSLTFLITPAIAQDKTAEIDKIFASLKADEPGCTVAMSQNGKLITERAYGLADLERGVPLKPNSVLDAGSIRKQFVAAAILLLVEEGKLSLTDDIRKHIPQLPDYGRTVTVDHLLTHTGGIRDWQPLLNLAGGDPDALSMILRQRELNFTPGEEWSYSNSGYVLLPEIIKRVSGLSFPEFAKKRLFEPLGMTSSVYVEDPLRLIPSRALAYSKDQAGWKMDMYLGNDRGGAGALFTTAADLVRWNDALTDNRLGKFVIEKLEEPTRLMNGRELSYARALFVDVRSGDKLVWHSGGAAGYSALAVRLPERKLSVAIMCNVDGGARDEYASRIFDLFLPPATESPDRLGAPAVDIPADQLRPRAGLFFDEKTGRPLTIGFNNGTLMVAGGGPLVPISSDRFRNRRTSPFFMSEAEFEMQFLSADRIEITTKEGEKSHYRRARGWAPTAEDLNALAGRYRSDELLATFEFTPGKEVLMGNANNSPRPPTPFKPVEPDTFQVAMTIIRFRRDAAGKVTGLEYSNPLLRNVKFDRVN